MTIEFKYEVGSKVMLEGYTPKMRILERSYTEGENANMETRYLCRYMNAVVYWFHESELTLD